jgi:hypothetical protein
VKKTFIILLIALVGLLFLNSCSTHAHVTQERAKKIAESIVKNEEQAKIINYSTPEIVEIKETQSHMVSFTSKDKISGLTDIKGKTVWKVTYNTESDGLLGPIVVYIDYNSGKIYGVDLRQ